MITKSQIEEMHQAILNEDDGYLEILEELVEIAKIAVSN